MPTAVKNILRFNMGAPLHRGGFVDLFFDDVHILHVFQGSEALGVERAFEAAFADRIVEFDERHRDFRLKVKALAGSDVSDGVGLAFFGKGDIHFLDSERELVIDARHFLTLLKHGKDVVVERV